MAGFVGIYADKTFPPEVIERAVTATVYSPKTRFKHLFSDSAFGLAQSYFPLLGEPASFSHDGIHVWIDGEIYNTRFLTDEIGPNAFAASLQRHYLQSKLPDLLRKVDGVYVAIIYDTVKDKLSVITDRYGLKPFYYAAEKDGLILAPELKCFSYMPGFDFTVRPELIDCFLDIEHLLGEDTWIRNVYMLRPASIYSYDLKIKKLTQDHYWSWNRYQENKKLSLEDAADEMGSLLDNAIRTRSEQNARLGISLSGGLDSRAILASSCQIPDLQTYTFGIEESADVRIAKAVAKIAGVPHTYYDMRTSDWLRKKFTGIWKTDGMINSYHMHYSHVMNKIPLLLDINLNGFLGDAVLGGSYLFLKRRKKFIGTRISRENASHFFGRHYERSNPDESFFDIEKIDPYLIYNRGRRLINMGTEEASKTIPQRLPFFENRLMDFAYTLPDIYRAGSNVYNKALLKKYPTFYRNVPNATTGLPIPYDKDLPYTLQERARYFLSLVRIKLGKPGGYTDINNWIRHPGTAAFIKGLLDPKTAIYRNFTSRNLLEEFFVPHLNSRNDLSRKVMGAVTLEIWLQQVFNKKFLDEND